MAQVTKNGDFAKRLVRHIRDELHTAGIDARVGTERVQGTKLVRVFVVADKFARLRPTERQDLVWRIVDQHFSRPDQLRISMIYTVTSDELPD